MKHPESPVSKQQWPESFENLLCSTRQGKHWVIIYLLDSYISLTIIILHGCGDNGLTVPFIRIFKDTYVKVLEMSPYHYTYTWKTSLILFRSGHRGLNLEAISKPIVSKLGKYMDRLGNANPFLEKQMYWHKCLLLILQSVWTQKKPKTNGCYLP